MSVNEVARAPALDAVLVDANPGSTLLLQDVAAMTLHQVSLERERESMWVFVHWPLRHGKGMHDPSIPPSRTLKQGRLHWTWIKTCPENLPARAYDGTKETTLRMNLMIVIYGFMVGEGEVESYTITGDTLVSSYIYTWTF